MAKLKENALSTYFISWLVFLNFYLISITLRKYFTYYVISSLASYLILAFFLIISSICYTLLHLIISISVLDFVFPFVHLCTKDQSQSHTESFFFLFCGRHVMKFQERSVFCLMIYLFPFISLSLP